MLGISESELHAQKRPYKLDSGDVLGIVIDGVLGDFSSKTPVHMPNDSGGLAGIGYPVFVRANGTLSLPQIKPISVRGLTVSQAERKISTTYLAKKILKQGRRVSVDLIRKRTVKITLVHNRSVDRTRTVSIVSLPVDQATPLFALSKSGASFESNNVRVQRMSPSRSGLLSENDIVHAESSSVGRFTTGGLLQPSQFQFSAQSNLSLLNAIAMSGGLQSSQLPFGPSEVWVIGSNGQQSRYQLKQLLNGSVRRPVRDGETVILKYQPREQLGNLLSGFLGVRLLLGR